MDIHKIYRRFFYINTRAINNWQATTSLSVSESAIIILTITILQKILLPTFQVNFPFVFISFMLLSFAFKYLNDKKFKKRDKEYTIEWLQETKKNKILYKVANAVLQIFLFAVCFFILMYLDGKL